jgi:ArsR family transcriptional regulator
MILDGVYNGNMKSVSVGVFRALGNPTRLKIVVYLLRNGETGCQKLSEHFPLSQPTLSHHFARLTESGVLHMRREGPAHFYAVNEQALATAGVSTRLLLEPMKG